MKKYSRKDSIALSRLMIECLGESDKYGLSEWQLLYGIEYALPICDHLHCKSCPLHECSDRIIKIYRSELPERKKVARKVLNLLRGLK